MGDHQEKAAKYLKHHVKALHGATVRAVALVRFPSKKAVAHSCFAGTTRAAKS